MNILFLCQPTSAGRVPPPTRHPLITAETSRNARHIHRGEPLRVFASARWTGILGLSIGRRWKRDGEFRPPCPRPLKSSDVDFSTTHREGQVTTEAPELGKLKGMKEQFHRPGIQQLSKVSRHCNFFLAFEPEIVLSVAHES